jgi:hypothetical protein
MATATRNSWKALQAPDSREKLLFEASFDDAQFRVLREGVVPKAMEDKWFIYFQEDWLHFHRSWTGAEIYALRLERAGDGWHVTDSWVNRDPNQYKASDTSYDRDLLRFIIDALMLHKPAKFPMPQGSGAKPQGVVQHHYVGRGYP